MLRREKPYVLRTALILVGLVSLIWAVVHLLRGDRNPSVFAAATYAFLVVAAIVFEKSRYRSKKIGGGDWRPTDEKFTDPVSAESVQVWFNSNTGEREYRPQDRS